MPLSRTHRNPRNLEKLTGRLLFFPQNADGTFSAAGQDLGDIVMHKRDTAVETAEAKFHTTAALAETVRTDTKSITTKFTITGHEVFREVLPMLIFGEENGTSNQSSGSTQTATISGVALRRVYKVGKLMLTSVTVMVASSAKIVGTRDAEGVITPANADVVLDAALGTIEVLDTGTILAADNLTVGFNCAAVTKRAYKAGTVGKRAGKFELYEYDGVTTPFKRANYFNGDLQAKDQGEQNSEGEFNQFELEVTVSGDWDAEEVEL